jgi:hypothetical protein
MAYYYEDKARQAVAQQQLCLAISPLEDSNCVLLLTAHNPHDVLVCGGATRIRRGKRCVETVAQQQL